MADPARTPKRIWAEIRAQAREGCKKSPCATVRYMLEGKGERIPPCALCVHEGKLKEVAGGGQ